MTKPLLASDRENETIKQQLIQFEAHIDAYRVSLNTEGVWLFLATLGCWSVNHAPSQLFAVLITFILFSYRIWSKMGDNRLFSSITEDLEEKIKTKLKDGDTKKARLHDLYQIRDVKLAMKSHLKSTAIFLLCYSFLIVSLVHFIQTSSH